jgi:hypothetical protein
MPRFQDIRSALKYTVRNLIAKRHTFIVSITASTKGKRDRMETLQVVAESMAYGNDERGLTLNLNFDPTYTPDNTRIRFEALPVF